MPFYLISGGNRRDGFFNDVEFYTNEEELNKSINNKSWKPKFSKINTYFKFINCQCDFDSDSELIIKEMSVKYGELLNKEFPNQLPMTDDELNFFIEKIKESQSEMYDDALDAMHNSKSNVKEKSSDWQQLYDEQTTKWDSETGGSWRDENDFG